MAKIHEPVRVAVNVMRARLTILGFNLAIITFQINELRILGGGIKLPGLEQAFYLSAAAALFLGMALSFAAMVCFIASNALDREGTCNHWSLLAGDLLMYLALAQTMAGFFGAFMSELDQVALPDPQEARMYALVIGSIDLAGGVAWAMAVYLGPLVSLLRSPYGRRITVALGLGYLLLLLLAGRVWATALLLEVQRPALAGAVQSWLGGLAAPFYW
jgi:hypothetical protein